MLDERYDELLCAAMEQLKLYYCPLTDGTPPLPGNAYLWAPELASAARVDRLWVYNGTTCAQARSRSIFHRQPGTSTIFRMASNKGCRCTSSFSPPTDRAPALARQLLAT